jgi:AAA domain-containing protein/TIR domain-containing protein
MLLTLDLHRKWRYRPLKPLIPFVEHESQVPLTSGRARIFISYKRNSDPDEAVALKISEALRGLHHNVFIDRDIPIGTRWAERIEFELSRSDFLITFLSAQSVLSEMVQGEIETAYHIAKKQGGRPRIFPVRLAYRQPFQFPISFYINPINWANWDSSADTSDLIDKIERAIAGEDLPFNNEQSKSQLIQVSDPEPMPQPLPQAQPLSLEMPEGTMDTQSQFYVERSSDAVAHDAIERQGVTITIKGPRQMGKSSLLIRTMAAAARAGKRIAFLDFQLVDKASLTNAERFFRQFCSWLSDELELEDRVEEHWKAPLGNSQCCTRYVSRYLLKQVGGPLVLAMDEVESVFDADFRSDFFSMLRSWHNNRATVPIWKQLDLALVTSTEPYQLIDNLNQSPFNVGEVIELADFSSAQVSDLNRRHGSPLTSDAERRLMALLDGHPYLVRRALYLVASRRMSVSDLFAKATDDRGPFGDHLRYHLFRMHDKKELVDGLRRVIDSHTCQDEHIFFRLRGAGLVRRDGRAVVPRCQLYADYFKEHLHE